MEFRRDHRLPLARMDELGFMDDAMEIRTTDVVYRSNYQLKIFCFLKYYKLSESVCYLLSTANKGGLETFCRFQFHLSTSVGSVKSLPVLQPRTFGFKLSFDEARRHGLIDTIYLWCVSHSKKFLKIRGPGYLENTPNSSGLFYRSHTPTFCVCSASTIECTRTSLPMR